MILWKDIDATLMISMETLKIINDYKAQSFKTSTCINDSYIIHVWFANLEVLRYMLLNFPVLG